MLIDRHVDTPLCRLKHLLCLRGLCLLLISFVSSIDQRRWKRRRELAAAPWSIQSIYIVLIIFLDYAILILIHLLCNFVLCYFLNYIWHIAPFDLVCAQL